MKINVKESSCFSKSRPFIVFLRIPVPKIWDVPTQDASDYNWVGGDPKGVAHWLTCVSFTIHG